MKALDLRRQNKPPNVLLYGPAGSGKTGLVSQAAGGFILDCDGGMRTALMLEDEFTPLRHSVEFETFIDQDPQNPGAYKKIKSKMLSIREEVAKGKWPYDSCHIDSLTGLVRAVQLDTMKAAGNALAVPKVQHYGIMTNELDVIFSLLRSLNILTIVTAHEMLIDTSKLGKEGEILTRIYSATKPHGVNKIPWLFDEVLYCKCKSKGQGNFQYSVSGRETSTRIARTRSGLKKDFVHNEVGLVGLLERIGYKYTPKVLKSKEHENE